MSIYLQIDELEADQIATNKGYGDFIRWTETLSPHDFAEIQILTEHGWNQEVPILLQQCKTALQEHPPTDAPTRSILENLINVLATQAMGAEVVSVTNGLSA